MESLEVPPAVARPDLSACDNKNNGRLKRSFFYNQNSTSLRISWAQRDALTLQNTGSHPLFLMDQSQQQVSGPNVMLLEVLRLLPSPVQDLPGVLGQVIEMIALHRVILSAVQKLRQHDETKRQAPLVAPSGSRPPLSDLLERFILTTFRSAQGSI